MRVIQYCLRNEYKTKQNKQTDGKRELPYRILKWWSWNVRMCESIFPTTVCCSELGFGVYYKCTCETVQHNQCALVYFFVFYLMYTHFDNACMPIDNPLLSLCRRNSLLFLSSSFEMLEKYLNFFRIFWAKIRLRGTLLAQYVNFCEYHSRKKN